MYWSPINRDEFVNLIAHQVYPEPKRLQKNATSKSLKLSASIIGAVWLNDPKDNSVRPDAFVVDEESIREFLSYTATYIGTHFPFSAFFNVISTDEFDSLQKRFSSSPSNEHVLNAATGAVLSEAYVQSGLRDGGVEVVTLQSCFATLSYCMAQAIYSGYHHEVSEELSWRWIRSRELVGLLPSKLNIRPENSFHVWSNIMAYADLSRTNSSKRARNSVSVNPTILEAIYEFEEHKELGQEIKQIVSKDVADIYEIVELMSGAKEERVNLFNKIVLDFHSATSISQEIAEFFVAFLLAKIGEGSILYMPLANLAAQRFPGAVIWYGFLSGLHKKTDVLTAGNCLGRRLARYIEAPNKKINSLDRDIGFHELELLHQDRHRDIGFRTEYSNLVSIEIFPLISGHFRVSREVKETRPLRHVEFDRNDLREIRHLIRRIDKMLNRIDTAPRQRELFSNDVSDARSGANRK